MARWRHSLAMAARLAVATPLSVAAVTTMVFVVATRVAVHLALWFVLIVGLSLAGVVPSGATLLLFGVAAAGVVLWLCYLVWTTLRTATRTEPAALLAETRTPSADTEYDLVDTLRELCRLLDRPTPALRIREDRRPICYTLRYAPSAPPSETLDRATLDLGPLDRTRDPDRRSDAEEPIPETHVVVVSTGLLQRTTPRQREAILAHELAHLQHRDVTLLQWLLVPIFWAEGANPRRGRVVGTLLTPLVWSSVGLATAALIVVGRGREFRADAGAAAITGDPAALADALRTFDPSAAERPDTDSRGVHLATDDVPDEDFRTVAALNVLPGLGRGSPLRYAHPPTDERTERLRTAAHSSNFPSNRS